jgi:hypothetical protein
MISPSSIVEAKTGSRDGMPRSVVFTRWAFVPVAGWGLSGQCRGGENLVGHMSHYSDFLFAPVSNDMDIECHT